MANPGFIQGQEKFKEQEQVKTIIAVGDGMADEPLEELGAKTPLEVAHTPNMDFFASHGTVGLLRTVPKNMDPGSDVANMSLMGYSPHQYYTGRAPLEAASMGISMSADDMAFRCNFVTLEKKGDGLLMNDYSGGGITTDVARVWIKELNGKLTRSGLSFHAGIAYRHILLFRNAGSRFKHLETTPPHDILGQEVGPHLPRGTGGEILVNLFEEACEVLTSLPGQSSGTPGTCTANAIWLWGQGHQPHMPTLNERFGIKGATICAVDLVKGLGRCAGLDPLEVPGATGDLDTNYQGKAVKVLKALDAYDLIFLHVEAPDEAGHQGNLKEKIRAIERFDQEVLGILRKGLAQRGGGYRLLVLPDHPTPIRTRTHSKAPVPFLLYASPSSLSLAHCFEPSAPPVNAYHEKEAAGTGIHIEEGHTMMEILFRQV